MNIIDLVPKIEREEAGDEIDRSLVRDCLKLFLYDYSMYKSK